MVMGRSEPAGSVMMPSATRSVPEILKTSLAAMSGAVTSTTTVATVVPERSALTSRVDSAGRDRDPVGSLGKQEPSANRDAIAAAARTGTVPGTRKPLLRRNTNGRGPSNPSESGRYRRVDPAQVLVRWKGDGGIGARRQRNTARGGSVGDGDVEQ